MLGRRELVIPNLVVQKHYVERIQESLLPGWELDRERRAACSRFYAEGDIAPVCRFIEQRFPPVFDNRDLRWSNALVHAGASHGPVFDAGAPNQASPKSIATATTTTTGNALDISALLH